MYYKIWKILLTKTMVPHDLRIIYIVKKGIKEPV